MKKIIVIFLFLLVCAGIAFYFFHPEKFQPLDPRKKEAAMEKLLGREPILSVNPRQHDWTLHTGKYVSFSYPAIAEIYTGTKLATNENFLEDFEFQQRDNPKYFFVTQVMRAPESNTYNDVSAVTLRRSDKNDYKETDIVVASTSAITFIKNNDNGVEKTGFILHAGNIYTFSITGGSDVIIPIFDRLFGSVKF